eukprot:jgi/Ulvmu1/11571/UM079_0014.1
MARSDTGATSSAPQRLSGKSSCPVPQECTIPGKKCFTIWTHEFIVDSAYEPIKAVGKGAYGVVCSAKKGEDKVAIKKIQNAFENDIDARRTLREVTLLRQLSHENIVNLVDVMAPTGSGKEQFKDVYLVYELMDTDLHQIIRSKQPLSDEHFQYFTYQILRGLKYVHSADVLHRDLKPSNLLLNASCDLKICDFGLARTREAPTNMTEYVVTRWYRAPELLLNSECYTPAIDMWSVGCIIAEMLGRRPLFAGKDYMDQLRLIVRALGMPTEEDMDFVEHDRARDYIRVKFGSFEAVDFSKVFKDANPLAIDLMKKMLKFNPSDRIDVNAALEHPYLSQFHDVAAEPKCPEPIFFGFEDENLTGAQVRERLYKEIAAHFRPS